MPKFRENVMHFKKYMLSLMVSRTARTEERNKVSSRATCVANGDPGLYVRVLLN